MLDEKKRCDIIANLQLQVSPKRFEHILRVEKKAIELAQKYNIDVEACQYSALLHDYAKEWTIEQYEKAVDTYNLDKTLLAYGSEILHGPVAAEVCAHYFDNDICIKEAIMYHTVGHTTMNDVAKVLFIADYIEDGRQFNDVHKARELADKSLDLAIIFRLQQTIIFLAQKGSVIYPQTLVAYNEWIKKEKIIEN